MRIDLLKGTVLSIDLQNQECSMECCEGRIWITRSQDVQDYIVGSAQTVSLKGPGKLVLEAVADSCVAIRTRPLENLGPHHCAHTVRQRIGTFWESLTMHGYRNPLTSGRITMSMCEDTKTTDNRGLL